MREERNGGRNETTKMRKKMGEEGRYEERKRGRNENAEIRGKRKREWEGETRTWR